MQIKKGEYRYVLKPCKILEAHLVLTGSLNDERAAPYKLAELDMADMADRYTEGSGKFNPQEGTPIYWAQGHFTGDLLIWPIPMEDYELKLTIQPHESALRKIAGQMLPTLNKGIREI